MEQPTQTISLRTGNTRVKGRRSAPKAEERRIAQRHEPYAYTFSDPSVGSLRVLNSENAWWTAEDGKVKVQKLIDAWKIDANDDEAIFYAGISIGQLKYFQQLHPELYTIKHLCKQNLGLIAKKNFAKQVERGEAALTYLRLKRKDEGYNPRVEMTGANGRELFEGLAQEIRELGNTLRNEPHDDDEQEPEYTGTPDAGDADAGQIGPGNEARPAETADQGQVIPA